MSNQPEKLGRDLDIQVAQLVLGHSVVRQKNGAYVEGTEKGQRPLPAYGKDMQAAWEVVEKVGIALIPVSGGSWFAMAGNGPDGWASPATFVEFLQKAEFMQAGAAVSESPALAICLAGLKAAEKRAAAATQPAATSPDGPSVVH